MHTSETTQASFCKRVVLIAAASALSLLSWGYQTVATAADSFEDGARALFFGHSFFVPVAKSFDKTAQQSALSNHQADFVFASGPKGTPGALWNDARKKDRIEEILSSGDVELVGMTAAANRGDVDALQAYQRWIDLALEYNPDTVFFIGASWVTGGPRMEASRFTQANEKIASTAYAEVVELRRQNPNTSIHFIDYGTTASMMRTMFDAGELDDITKLTAGNIERGRSPNGERNRRPLGRIRERQQQTTSDERGGVLAGGTPEGPSEALFADGAMGHAGPMMTQMSALAWLHLLYGVDIDGVDMGNWNEADVQTIVSETIESNLQYTP